MDSIVGFHVVVDYSSEIVLPDVKSLLFLVEVVYFPCNGDAFVDMQWFEKFQGSTRKETRVDILLHIDMN